jgi:hypothetical protein
MDTDLNEYHSREENVKLASNESSLEDQTKYNFLRPLHYKNKTSKLEVTVNLHLILDQVTNYLN